MSAVFEFADVHIPDVCTPPAGKLVGTLTIVVPEDQYTITFTVDGQRIGSCTVQDSDQDANGQIAISCSHSARGPRANVLVRVNGSGGNLPEPICLRSNL